jgi:hypothetical protein
MPHHRPGQQVQDSRWTALLSLLWADAMALGPCGLLPLLAVPGWGKVAVAWGAYASYPGVGWAPCLSGPPLYSPYSPNYGAGPHLGAGSPTEIGLPLGWVSWWSVLGTEAWVRVEGTGSSRPWTQVRPSSREPEGPGSQGQGSAQSLPAAIYGLWLVPPCPGLGVTVG